MKRWVFSLSISCCLLAAPLQAATSLCSHSEDDIFSCSVGRKLISVCAPHNVTEGSGYVQYRYGTPQKIELSLPSDTSSPSANRPLFGELMFSGGGGDYLRFQTTTYDYVVYTAMGKGWGEKDGVSIEKNGQSLKHISCVDEPMSHMGEDFSKKAGLKADTEDFELP